MGFRITMHYDASFQDTDAAIWRTCYLLTLSFERCGLPVFVSALNMLRGLRGDSDLSWRTRMGGKEVPAARMRLRSIGPDDRSDHCRTRFLSTLGAPSSAPPGGSSKTPPGGGAGCRVSAP